MLTLREADVVRLLARGCSYAEIAGQLGISAHTVASHVKNAYRKLDVHCAAAAVMRAIELRVFVPAGPEDGGMLRHEATLP
jgi:DNA-binding CsgD family transcriptional regulator